MAFVPYKPSSGAWSNIENETYGQKFYPLQEGKGKGSPIQLVSPAQGSIQRAKSDLKRQLSEARCQTGSGAPKRKRKKTTTKKPKKKPVKKVKKKVVPKKKRKKVVKR